MIKYSQIMTHYSFTMTHHFHIMTTFPYKDSLSQPMYPFRYLILTVTSYVILHYPTACITSIHPTSHLYPSLYPIGSHQVFTSLPQDSLSHLLFHLSHRATHKSKTHLVYIFLVLSNPCRVEWIIWCGD